METSKEDKIALLIDGDNAQSKYIENMLAEAGKHGKVTIRRIYGNWTDNRLSGWKEQINKFAIKPIQKFDLAKGKNSTDTAMIIEAMDILHGKNITGFCIASSDSDYTGLAQRIREDGVFVMGIGEAGKTTNAFVNACDIFIFTENFDEENIAKTKKNEEKQYTFFLDELLPDNLSAIDIPKATLELPINNITKKPINLKLIGIAFEMVVGDNGLANMGDIGTALRKLDPSFDCRSYGSATTAKLFKRLPDIFEMVYKDNGTALYIKMKQ